MSAPRVTISRDAQDATGRPGLWLFLRLCTWEGITPVEQPTIRLGLALWRQRRFARARAVLAGVGLYAEHPTPHGIPAAGETGPLGHN
jgi:hypothetical protein